MYGMPSLKFEQMGFRVEDGERLYRLVIGGRTVREGLTIDQVIEAINAQDEERLGEEHGPLSPAEAGQLPLQGSHGDAEARRKARREPGWRR